MCSSRASAMVRLRRLRPPSCRPSISSLVSSLAANAARSTCFRVLNSMLTMIARKILMPTSAIRAREAITNAGQRHWSMLLLRNASQSVSETRALRAPKHEGRDNTAAVQHNARARAHTADPQAQEPLSLWTEVWPTRPVHTQAVNRQNEGEEEAPVLASVLLLGSLTRNRTAACFTDY